MPLKAGPSDTTQFSITLPAQAIAMMRLAEGVRLFMLDQVEEAAAVFESTFQLAEKTGVKNVYTYPHLTWLASALRRQAEKTSPWAPKQRDELLKRASRVVNKAIKIARTWQSDLPHALREAGLIAAMQGDLSWASKHLEESLSVAERQSARFEHAQTLLARSQVRLALGRPGAAEEIDDARQVLNSLGADFARVRARS